MLVWAERGVFIQKTPVIDKEEKALKRLQVNINRILTGLKGNS